MNSTLSYSEHQTITFGQAGQTVEFYPPHSRLIYDGAPAAAATATVFEAGVPDDGVAEFTPSVTLDPVDAATDAAAGVNEARPRRIPLTSTANIVAGRRYLITDADTGQREVVVPVAIATDDYVDIEGELSLDYGMGSTFKGLQHQFTVDATWVADESKINADGQPYRVLWEYTLVTLRRHHTTIDLFRRQFQHGVTEQDLMGIYPDLGAYKDIHGTGHNYLRELHRAERQVQLDLKLKGMDPDALTDTIMRDELVLSAWSHALAKGGVAPAGWGIVEWETRAAREYFSKFHAVVQAKPQQTDENGAMFRRQMAHDFVR